MSLLYKDTPVGFHRVLSGPLDDHEVFVSNAQLLEYCKSGTAYHGQRVLLTYDDLFDQPCVIKRGRQSELIPIMELPAGIELVTKKEQSGEVYALVTYFNDGTIYEEDKDIILKLDDFCYFSILTQAALLSGNAEEINYRFEYKNGITETVTSGDASAGTAGDIVNKIKDNLSVGNRFKVWVRCTNYYNAMGV